MRLLLLLAALLPACTVSSYTDGPVRLVRCSLGINATAAKIHVLTLKNGSRELIVDGVASSQSPEVKAVAGSVVQGAVTGLGMALKAP